MTECQPLLNSWQVLPAVAGRCCPLPASSWLFYSLSLFSFYPNKGTALPHGYCPKTTNNTDVLCHSLRLVESRGNPDRPNVICKKWRTKAEEACALHNRVWTDSHDETAASDDGGGDGEGSQVVVVWTVTDQAWPVLSKKRQGCHLLTLY